MNMKKELIPQLRFPEYTQAHSLWLENLVGDSIKTLTPPKKLQKRLVSIQLLTNLKNSFVDIQTMILP